MNERFQNKYRIPSTRLQTWNYGDPGFYFITICTAHRDHYFGEIREGAMRLSALGYAVETEWLKTPELRLDMNLQLGEFVVMPNHFHGILMIGENQYNTSGHDNDQAVRNQFGPQAKNLASVLRGFKSAVTTFARKNNIPFDWQARYHDHLIRTKDSFDRISQYIIDNPAKWEEDRFFT